MDDKLTFKDLAIASRENAIKTGMGLIIPYVGGGLADIYFDLQNEKRLKRLESLYKDLAEKLKQLLDFDLDSENPEQLIGIIETIHEQIEKANSKTKQQYFVNAYANLLLKREDKSFDRDEYFIEVLSSLTNFELDLFSDLYRAIHTYEPFDFQKGTDGSLYIGAANRLSDFGLVDKIVSKIEFGAVVQYGYNMTKLGKAFADFILTTPSS